MTGQKFAKISIYEPGKVYSWKLVAHEQYVVIGNRTNRMYKCGQATHLLTSVRFFIPIFTNLWVKMIDKAKGFGFRFFKLTLVYRRFRKWRTSSYGLGGGGGGGQQHTKWIMGWSAIFKMADRSMMYASGACPPFTKSSIAHLKLCLKSGWGLLFEREENQASWSGSVSSRHLAQSEKFLDLGTARSRDHLATSTRV